MIWSIYKYFRPSSLGFLLEKNSEIAETNTASDDTTLKMLYADARPKQKATTALTPQPKPKEETMQRRQPYHVPLGTPVMYELPPKWADKEEVIQRSKGEVKMPAPIIPNVPSTIDELTMSFQTLQGTQPSKNRYKD